MIYKLRIEKAVVKSLKKINEPYYFKIKTAILNLAKNPRPAGYKKLKGRDGFRIRVSNYRILYDIFDDILTVEVIDLGHRKDVYE
ncbi:MAG: type II toxin-antitoxin system RelE/ParE family toxin [Bacteroidota bacterium]